MKTLIDINNYPVSVVLKTLVKDKTTGQNIILATTARSKRGRVFGKTKQITEELLQSIGADLIQPRVAKSLEKQAERTREKAEVFTPSWICNKMNNHCDAEWFGRENVFNTEVTLDSSNLDTVVTSAAISRISTSPNSTNLRQYLTHLILDNCTWTNPV